VLGESVAAAIAGLDTGSSGTAVVVALLGLAIAAAVWWLYFDRWQGMPAGRVRSGAVWAQGHFFMFAGIAAAAVGVSMLSRRPLTASRSGSPNGSRSAPAWPPTCWPWR
jgi:low temperature requirement protein LtrA